MIKIRDIGRTGDQAKSGVGFPKHKCAVWIARRHHDALWRLGHLFHHQGTIHAHRYRILFYVTARPGENFPGIIVQKIDANLLEDTHRRVMNFVDAFSIQRLNRGIEVSRLTPG